MEILLIIYLYILATFAMIPLFVILIGIEDDTIIDSNLNEKLILENEKFIIVATLLWPLLPFAYLAKQLLLYVKNILQKIRKRIKKETLC